MGNPIFPLPSSISRLPLKPSLIIKRIMNLTVQYHGEKNDTGNTEDGEIGGIRRQKEKKGNFYAEINSSKHILVKPSF